MSRLFVFFLWIFSCPNINFGFHIFYHQMTFSFSFCIQTSKPASASSSSLSLSLTLAKESKVLLDLMLMLWNLCLKLSFCWNKTFGLFSSSPWTAVVDREEEDNDGDYDDNVGDTFLKALTSPVLNCEIPATWYVFSLWNNLNCNNSERHGKAK